MKNSFLILALLCATSIIAQNKLTLSQLEEQKTYKLHQVGKPQKVYSLLLSCEDVQDEFERKQLFESVYKIKGELINLQKIEFVNCAAMSFDFSKFPNLQIVRLNRTYLRALPVSLKTCQQLKVLDLSGNEFKSFPGDILEMQNLEVLVLGNFRFGYNQIAQLPDGIGKLKNLKKLVAVQNNITSLPASIGELKSLEELNLGTNKIKELPASIGKLANLRILNIESNQVTTLPKSMVHLNNLESIILKDNKSIELQNTITLLAMLENLVSIDLSKNNISSLPENINLLKCKHLDLSLNPGIDVPNTMAVISGMADLKSLSFAYCQVKQMPKANYNLHLEELDLSNNDLEALDASFAELHGLQHLNLSSNKNINYGKVFKVLEEMDSLQSLTLQSCELEELPKDISRIVQLKRLDISHNRSINLEGAVKLLSPLVNLEELDISFNYNHGGSLPENFILLPNVKVLVSKQNQAIQPSVYVKLLMEMENLQGVQTELISEHLSKDEQIEMYKNISYQ